MAMISLLLVMVVFVIAVFVIGVLPIVLGSFLYHRTRYKRTGIALRIFGYFIIVPVIFVCLLFACDFLIA